MMDTKLVWRLSIFLAIGAVVVAIAFLLSPEIATPAEQAPGYGVETVAPPAVSRPPELLAPTTPIVPTAPATQNTVTTTGPVSSETVISVGTLAGQVLTWVAAVFGVPIGTLLTAWLYRLFALAGVAMTNAMRARLQEVVINGINIGAKAAQQDLAGRGQVEIKNAAVANAVAYVQMHGVESLQAIGINPKSDIAVEAIKARIETAIVDANMPTAKIMEPAPAPVPVPVLPVSLQKTP